MEAASATRLSSENKAESSIRSPGLPLNSIRYCIYSKRRVILRIHLNIIRQSFQHRCGLTFISSMVWLAVSRWASALWQWKYGSILDRSTNSWAYTGQNLNLQMISYFGSGLSNTRDPTVQPCKALKQTIHTFLYLKGDPNMSNWRKSNERRSVCSAEPQLVSSGVWHLGLKLLSLVCWVFRQPSKTYNDYTSYQKKDTKDCIRCRHTHLLS